MQAVEEDAAPAKKEKTHFTVKLTELKAADKVKLIKEVKNCMEGINLVQVRCFYMNSQANDMGMFFYRPLWQKN